MPLLRPIAQLADIPEHQDGAAGKAGEYINGRAHRGGVCVVSVIDHAHTVFRQLRDGATLDRLHGAKPGGDAEQRHAQGVSGSGGSHGIGDVMGAEQVQLNVLDTFRCVQIEGRATTGISGQVAGVEVSLSVAQGEGQHFAHARTGLPDAEGFVIEVEHGDAVGRQPVDDFAFGFDDFFRAAKLTNVRGAGIVEDRHVRLGQANGVSDFAETRGAQFDHRRTVFRGQFEQGQRRAEVVVQIATGRQYRTARAQDAREHLLDRGLAAGASDGSDWLSECSTVQRAQLAEGLTGVFDQQLRQRAVGNFTFDQCSDGAFGGDIVQVVMTVETRAGQRNKQLTRLDRTAVDADAVETGITRDQACVERVGQFAEFEGLKHGPPPKRSGRDRPRPDRRKRGARR
ncbi:hypothetical protein D3C85_712910 [compost metagenome]